MDNTRKNERISTHIGIMAGTMVGVGLQAESYFLAITGFVCVGLALWMDWNGR